MCQEAFVYAGQLKFRLVSYIKTWPESCSNSNDHSLQPWQTEKHLRLHNMPNLESWYLSYCILPVHWTTLFILLWPFTSARHFCLQNCLTQDVFHTFLCRGVGVCVWNPWRSAVSEIPKPVRLAPTTIPRSKSLQSRYPLSVSDFMHGHVIGSPYRISSFIWLLWPKVFESAKKINKFARHLQIFLWVLFIHLFLQKTT